MLDFIRDQEPVRLSFIDGEFQPFSAAPSCAANPSWQNAPKVEFRWSIDLDPCPPPACCACGKPTPLLRSVERPICRACAMIDDHLRIAGL